MEKTELVTKDDPRKFKTMAVIGQKGPNLADLIFGIVEKTVSELSGGIGERFIIVYDTETMMATQLFNLSLFDFTNTIDSVDKWKEFIDKYFPKSYYSYEEGVPYEENQKVNNRRTKRSRW